MLVGNKSKPVKGTNTGIIYPLGVCKSYEFEQTMTLNQIAKNTSNFKVYITDPGMATYFSIDLMSHIGTQPKLKQGKKSSYDVRIRMEDQRKPGQEHVCDESPNYSFSDCVDEYIQKDLIKVTFNYFRKCAIIILIILTMFRKLDAFLHFSQTRIHAMELSTTKLCTTISNQIFILNI